MTVRNYDSIAPRKLAFLGLGVMGYPMAGHLQRAGHSVTVYNRTASKAAQWVAEYGGTHADTPRAASTDADIVFACVGNDDDLRSIVIGDAGALAGMKPGAIFCDHTTASASVARELSAAATGKGLHFIDAPVRRQLGCHQRRAHCHVRRQCRRVRGDTTGGDGIF
jgi:3-hydroxyisobutyrate dehydrogenase